LVDAAILPVKRLDQAKHRLSAALDVGQRMRIAEALLEDALALAARCDFVRWWVVSSDEAVLGRAVATGFEAIDDGGAKLNDALGKAVGAAITAGATSVTIVPVDVPLARREDLQDVLDTGATSDVVAVPADEDGGTNALYLSPPDVLVPSFGPGSLKGHIAAAERLGLRCALLPLSRLGLDIDTVEDARAFLLREPVGATARALSGLRLESEP
jgi:2-phospho-L-lactate guanylyltransferase